MTDHDALTITMILAPWVVLIAMMIRRLFDD